MTILILGVLLSGLFLLLLMMAIDEDGFSWKYLLSLIPLVFSIVVSSVVIIPANTVGIIYSPFNGVQESTLGEGFHSKGIFDKIYNINTEVQSKTIPNVYGQTKDSQYITMTVDVKYRVDASKAYEVFRQYRNLDNLSQSFIAPMVQRSIETVTTQYNIMEVLGEKRNQLYKEIELDLNERLSTAGISFVSINFSDTDAGEAIEKAIQKEAIAKKEVETAEQERLKVEVEAQKRVVEAQANMEKAKIEAETKRIQAEAEAAANKIIAESVTPELLAKMEMEARQKWGWITVQGGNVITDVR